MDPLWRSFLNIVHENGGWRGAQIPWDPVEEVREDGGYDVLAREGAATELKELANRMQQTTAQEEYDAAVDRVVIEDD